MKEVNQHKSSITISKTISNSNISAVNQQKESWGVDSEGAIYVHTERGNMSPEEYIRDLLSSHISIDKVVEEIAKFDIKYGLNGEPVENPLMRLNDFKSMLQQKLKALKE